MRKEGTIDDAYPVPVEILDGMDNENAARIAAVENLQREQLHPLDEGEAFARLLQPGGSVEAITEKTGLSMATVRRRLALASLTPEVKKAFLSGLFTLRVAEALTLGSRGQQRSLLESLRSPEPPDADDIRDLLLGQKPTLAMAIFPREQYRGTLTTDLFADDETTYCDDIDQFLGLQNEAVTVLAEEKRGTAAWVEALHLHSVPWWQFREAEGDEPSGVVINLHPSGAVEIREGLARHAVKASVSQATRVSPIAPRPPRERPAFSAELLRHAGCQRSAIVQAALLANPRKAREAAVTLLLVNYRRDSGIRLTLHECHSSPAAGRSQRSHQFLKEAVDDSMTRLGFITDAEGSVRHEGPFRLFNDQDALAVLDAVRRLPDGHLDRLLSLLPLLCLGQDHVDAVDTGDTLFNRIAVDLGVDTRSWWKPDAAFLALLTREQLLQVAGESGAHLKGMNGWTKRRLADELAVHFTVRSDPEKMRDRPAATWLPGLLGFPAVASVLKNPV